MKKDYGNVCTFGYHQATPCLHLGIGPGPWEVHEDAHPPFIFLGRVGCILPYKSLSLLVIAWLCLLIVLSYPGFFWCAFSQALEPEAEAYVLPLYEEVQSQGTGEKENGNESRKEGNLGVNFSELLGQAYVVSAESYLSINRKSCVGDKEYLVKV